MGRILMVLRPAKGGAYAHVARMSGELAARGHDVAMCGPLGGRRADLAVPVIEVDIGRDPSPIADLRAVREVARAIRRFKPDLVHAHGSKGGTFARLARLSSPGLPVAYTPHNYAFANYFAGRTHQLIFRGLETALTPLTSLVLCCCEAERHLAAQVGLRKRSRVVYNGIVPRPRQAPSAALEALRKPQGAILLSVTELHERKGLPSLLEAMPSVLSAYPNTVVAIAGEGPARSRTEVQIAELGITDSVHLLGERDDVPGLLSAADVFLLPSWSEAFPYAMLEAMETSLPIVATDVGGVGEAIEDGVTGRLVDAHEAPALGAAIIDLLADPEEAQRLGAAARARLEARFTFARAVDATLAAYGELGFR